MAEKTCAACGLELDVDVITVTMCGCTAEACSEQRAGKLSRTGAQQ